MIFIVVEQPRSAIESRARPVNFTNPRVELTAAIRKPVWVERMLYVPEDNEKNI